MPRADKPHPLPAPRRRGKSPCTSEWDYTPEEMEFAVALDRYKRANRRPFPTCAEALAVLRSLGYRKVAPREPLPGCHC